MSSERIIDLKTAYSNLGVAFGTDYKTVHKIYKEKIRASHPDKGGIDEEARDLNASLQAIKDYVEDPSTLRFISADQEGIRNMTRSILTYYNGEKTIYPTADFIRKYSDHLTLCLEILSINLARYIKSIDHQHKPSALNDNVDDALKYNAENYTLYELTLLYDLIINGNLQFNYPLRYTENSKADLAHELLVAIINTERFDRKTLAKAKKEFFHHDQAENINDWLFLIAIGLFLACLCIPGFIMSCMSDAAAMAFFNTIIIPGLSIGGAIFLFGVAVPTILAISAMVHRKYMLRNYDYVNSAVRDFVQNRFLRHYTLGNKLYYEMPQDGAKSINQLVESLEKLAPSFTEQNTLAAPSFGYHESTKRGLYRFFVSTEKNSVFEESKPLPKNHSDTQSKGFSPCGSDDID